MYRLVFPGFSYPLYVLQDTSNYVLHTLGKKLIPTIISLISMVVFRMLWTLTIFEHFHSLSSLYMLYPFSFVVSDEAES